MVDSLVPVIPEIIQTVDVAFGCLTEFECGLILRWLHTRRIQDLRD